MAPRPISGPIGDRSAAIQGFALQRDLDDAGFPVVELASGGTALRRFRTATPGTSRRSRWGPSTAVRRWSPLAWRPQTGQLDGRSVNATANTATLYLVDP